MKKNLRYLTASLATTAFLASSSSYALGVGDIKMQSALNQRLNAEIALILSDGENPADLKIDLAPITKFDEAGIPWSLFLSKIQFQTVTENGRTFIKLSSKEVLKEPFLDFIVQIQGLKNHLYREFTVLVDPPEAYQTLEEPSTPPKNVSQHFVPVPVHHVIQKPRNVVVRPKITTAKPVANITPLPKAESTNILPRPVSAVPSPAPELNQKIVELEKQLSEMKQAMAEQNAQIAALKISNSQPAAIVQSEIKSELTSPEIVLPSAQPPVLETRLSETPQPPVVATPVIQTPTPQISHPPAATTTDFIADMLNSVTPIYANMSSDSYTYIAGAASSLLLSLLGLLRWKNRRNAQKSNDVENRVEPEIVSKNDQQPVIVEVENLLKSTEQSMDKMFADEEMMSNDDEDFNQLEAESFSELNSLTNNDTPKNNASDVLYRVDVYCAYGNFDHAILLLNDEFIRHPEENAYALRLLRLYVSQNKKEDFKTFVEKLIKQGKQNESEFWASVSNIVTDFAPDVFLPEQPNFSESHEEMESFIFENISTFEKRDDSTFSLDSELDNTFDFTKFEVQPEKGDDEELTFSLDSDLDEAFDFTKFEVQTEKNKGEGLTFSLDSELDDTFDFTKFEDEPAKKVEEPTFSLDSEFELDFTAFQPEKEVETIAPKMAFEPEFELDFTSFDIQKKVDMKKD